jgi:hypothetical protein
MRAARRLVFDSDQMGLRQDLSRNSSGTTNLTPVCHGR